MADEEKAIEMCVVGLVIDPFTQSPIVLLKDSASEATLPIWIGLAEATAIAMMLKKITPPRPLTHDLLFDLINQSGATLKRVFISELKESTYIAELSLTINNKQVILDCRPSDAIAMALRCDVPIFVNESVIKNAKVSVTVHPVTAPSVPPDFEQFVPEPDFRSIDKDKWSDILSELHPEDFKYKM